MQPLLLLLVFSVLVGAVVCKCNSIYDSPAMPLPWTMPLCLDNPQMEGNPVIIAQNLLMNDPSSTAYYPKSFAVQGTFNAATNQAIQAFQTVHKLTVNGVLDSATAQALLDCCSDDGIKDDGFTAASLGYLYKISIPVPSNRSVEVTATLFDKDNNFIMTFPVRAHGHRDDNGAWPWPDFGSTPPDFGLNQFTSNGNTVTGIFEIDLNSPEPNPQLYGPWPVNRIVRGLKGNAAWLTPNIRDGMLIHTGNWTTEATGVWTPDSSMPNSSGCLHSHPESVERIYKELLALGVVVNENPFSGKDYPFSPQGIAVIYSSPTAVVDMTEGAVQR